MASYVVIAGTFTVALSWAQAETMIIAAGITAGSIDRTSDGEVGSNGASKLGY